MEIPYAKEEAVKSNNTTHVLGVLMLLSIAISASAESGWYLLVPPTSEYNEHADYLKGFNILDGQPLAQWSQQSAYDRASECEAAKARLILANQNLYSKSSEDYIKAIGEKKDADILKMMRSSTESKNAIVKASIASRCIKSDDATLSK